MTVPGAVYEERRRLGLRSGAGARSGIAVQMPERHRRHFGYVATVSFGPASRTVVAAIRVVYKDKEGTLDLWDIGREPKVLLQRIEGVYPRVAVSPDGRLLATATPFGQGVALWSVPARIPDLDN